MSSSRKLFTRTAGGCGIFQLLMVICVIATANSGDPLLFTIGFLTKNPNYFECNNNNQGEWKSCTREYVCQSNLSTDNYRPLKNDSEYIDNWSSADKMNLLCEDK